MSYLVYCCECNHEIEVKEDDKFFCPRCKREVERITFQRPKLPFDPRRTFQVDDRQQGPL